MNNKLLCKILAFSLMISCANSTQICKETIPLEASYIFEESLTVNESFKSNYYKKIKSYVPAEGFVPNPDMAYEICEIILKQIYGEEIIEEEKPFSIKLADDIWIIEGNIKEEMDGGVAYVEIRKSTGEILKVIHTK